MTIIIIRKKCGILQELTEMWHRDMKWANAVGKMAPVDLLEAGCHKPLVCQRWHIICGVQ